MWGEDDRENRIAAHLVAFRNRFQVEHHEARESRSCCIRVNSFSLEIDFNSFVSSAKRCMVQNEVAVGMSFTKIRNRRGPRTLPWGTPDRTGSNSDEQPSIQTRWERWER